MVFLEYIVQLLLVLKISQNLQESTSARVSFLIKLQTSACNSIKKENLAQVFSCEFRKIFKNAFFIEILWASASEFESQN